MLKKVIIQGFKSFAEKTEIILDPLITGIVGPNGSGKSNVAEAIRWALGETKSKIMRFERQQDVIFTGSQGRKPVGMAEVTLILDNSQKYFSLPYDEIAITRRCFRSGESEFFINKSPCRLKDVHELLVDTGLGKHGYAIIGQGQVDEILFSSPEEKRSYLEEAAGINRFRLREQEAKKKLIETQNGITRLEDLSRELQAELLAKEEQVKKAKNYLLLKDELTAKAQKFYGVKIKNLESNLRKNEEKIINLKNLLEKTQAEILQLEATQQDLLLKEQKASLSRALAQKIVGNLENCLDKLVNTKQYQITEKERIEKELQNLKKLIKNNGFRLLELRLELNNYHTKLKTLKEKEKELLIQLKNQQKKLGVDEEKLQELRKNLEGLKDELFEVNFKEVSLKNEINFLSENSERINNENLKLQKEISNLDQDVIETNELLAKNLAEQKYVKLKQEELNKELEWHKKRLTFLNKELLILQNEKIVLEKKYHEISARLQVLNKLEDSYEGYGKEIKNLFDLKRKGVLPNQQNIIGTVGEYLEVSEKYRLAIETALGASIRNVIINKAQELEPIITYLKENKLGRITFLAMDLLSNENNTVNFSELLKIDGYIGTAIDLISYPINLAKVYDNLLGRVLVGRDYSSCLKIAKITKHRFKVVSLEGELLLPGGIIIGGTTTFQTSVLQRKNEIKALTKQNDELEEKNNKAMAAISDLLIEQEEIKIKITTLEEKLNELEGNLRELAFNEQKLKEKKVELLNRSLELKKQFAANSSENENLFREKEKREKEIQNIVETKVLLQENIKKLEEQITLTDGLITENQSLYQALALEKVQIEKELENIKNLYLEKSNQKNEYIERHLVNVRTVIELKQKFAIVQKELRNLENKINLHREILESSSKYYQEENFTYEKVKNNLLEIQNNLSGLQKSSQRYITELSRLESKQRNLMEEINSLKLLLTEKYGIVLGDEETNNDEGPEITDETEIEQLYQRLCQLQPVNIYVIDEYKRLQERITFLNQQKEDLKEAKQQLEKLLEQLNEEIEQKFNEFLSLLNHEYDAVFKELFGGGRASLEKIGETSREGVEIIVELPGKKQQPLGVLSGGERALATIALLFALFNLKPSPFCVLDEIDAALDEVNVQRFSSYLTKIGQKSQVLIITHRRGSMEACAKLIGISMQEGCSKVLSLTLQGIKAG